VLPRASARGESRRKEPAQGFLATLNRIGVRLVVDEHPAARRPHQAGVAQDAKMLRDGTLRDAELHGQRSDAQSPLRHQLEDA
jgi:hypothetical protein